MTVLILHGLGGSDFPHWQAQLASDLVEDDRMTVLFPDLEERDAPTLTQWLEELHALMTDERPDVVVCHSLATILWFHYLKLYPQTHIAKQLLVAPPDLMTPLADAPTFFPVALPDLSTHAQSSLLLLSTNDPYLPLPQAQELASRITIPVQWIQEGGHINTSAGFGEWELPRQWIMG